jgi:zinc transport system substrate-binding protein
VRISHPGTATGAAIGFAAALCLALSARADAPPVAVSVPPVHSLVAGVMEGVGAPHLLIRGGRSPHDVSLRPSDIRRLNDAALVVWVGPGLEYFLAKPLERRKKDSVLALYDAPGVVALPRRAGGAWRSDDREHDQGHGHDHPADRAGEVSHGLSPFYIDSHIWLSPGNARAIVSAVAGRLRGLDPTNAAAYSANETRTLRRVAALDLEIGATLMPVRRVPYIVFHDAYQYFERHYGLNAAGAITASPDRMPSAHRLAEIRRRIMESRAACVFREPQFPPRLIDTIVAGTSARIGVLDPLGADIAPGPDHWFALMRGLAGALVKCLKPARNGSGYFRFQLPSCARNQVPAGAFRMIWAA